MLADLDEQPRILHRDDSLRGEFCTSAIWRSENAGLRHGTG